MKLLLDSCISYFAVKELRKCNHDVVWIPETGKDPGDRAIIKKAFKEQRVLVTADKDFGELVFFQKMDAPTIIRLVDMRAIIQGRAILNIIQAYEEEMEKGAIITADPYRVRIRSIS